MTRSGRILRALAWSGLFLCGPLALAAPAAAADTAEAILEQRCGECHKRLPDGTINRIGKIRQTPEGWQMTIARMGWAHGVKVSQDEAHTLIKYLSDRQGLAPEEAAPFRYALERQPHTVEAAPEGNLGQLCARCHTYARVGLQRRDASEWRKLAHFHLGQWPTTEYQALGRDRKWWEIASKQVPPQLGKKYPLSTEAWTRWQKQPKASLEGTWRLAGYRPGHGAYGGTATIAKGPGEDRYQVTYKLTTAAGEALTGTSSAVVYTGYEWRGVASLGAEEVREVFAVARDGKSMRGRWFLADADETGATFEAVRDGASTVLGLSRPYLRAGETAQITLWGAGLGATADLGPGVKTEVVSRSEDAVVVKATAAADARPGPRDLASGKARAKGLLTVYRGVDSVRVEPAFAIARVGGGGGPRPPVVTQFEAVGYLHGKDGKPGTRDDVRIGALPATWSLGPFNEPAEQMKDVDFAGTIDAKGLFRPAEPGPNPKRPFHTNNVGDLTVKAAVDAGGNKAEGSGHLIVTVQRWVDPAIR